MSEADPFFPLISDTPTDHFSASEFGGLPGMIQPPPHVPDASEQLALNYRAATEPLASE